MSQTEKREGDDGKATRTGRRDAARHARVLFEAVDERKGHQPQLSLCAVLEVWTLWKSVGVWDHFFRFFCYRFSVVSVEKQEAP